MGRRSRRLCLLRGRVGDLFGSSRGIGLFGMFGSFSMDIVELWNGFEVWIKC